MRTLTPRIIICIDDGLVQSVTFDGIDLAHVQVVKIDYDTDGAIAEDGVVLVGGVEAFFDVLDMEQASDDEAKAVSAAYGRWSHTEG